MSERKVVAQKLTYEDALAATVEYYDGDLLAASTVVKKYLLRDKEGNYLEKTPDDMHNRLASEFTRIEKKMNPKLDEAGYYEKVRGLMHRFNKVVPQGSPLAGIGNKHHVQSLSNCTVIDSPDDTITGIFKAGLEMAQLQKRRAGVGLDVSKLRPSGSIVNNSAEISSGTPCFSDFYSHITRMIGQKGRMGALMITIDIKHPDAKVFATMKNDLTKVTGANVSIKITDEFMRAVETDGDFIQQWPVDVPKNQAKVVNVIKARELWNTIVDSAWRTAEPGLLFWDNYCSNLPAHQYDQFKTVSTNPCLTGDMRLLTNNGYITLKKLWEESRIEYRDVKSFESLPKIKIINRHGRVTATTVYKTADSAPVYRVSFEDGTSIKATENHTFILVDGVRKQLKDLQVGDEVPVVEGVGDFGPANNKDYGLLAGWVIGGGSISNAGAQQRAHVRAWDSDIEDVCPVLKKALVSVYDRHNKSSNQEPEFNFISRKHTGFDYTMANVDSNVLGRLLKEDGITVGNKHQIPESIWLSNKETVSAFLRGLFSADGSVQVSNYKKSISIRLAQATSGTPDLTLGCQLLLSQFGIKSSVRLRRKAFKQLMNDGKGGEKLYNRKPSWELIISGRQNCKRYSEEIGFIQACKNQKLQEWLVSFLDSNNSGVKWKTKIKSIDFVGSEATYCLTEFDNNEICINRIAIAQCAEIALSAYDSCRLISMNLTGWVSGAFTASSSFDFDEYHKDVRTAQRMSDGLVELELEAVQNIINSADDVVEKDLWNKIYLAAHNGRRTGLGTHGLGDTLLKLGLRYDSDEGIAFVDKLYRTHMEASYEESISLAKERGAFPIWDWELDKKSAFIKRLPKRLRDDVKKHGRRNIANLTVAPTGSISIASQTSSGVEAAFRWVYDRRTKITSDSSARVDYVDALGDKWTQFRVLHHVVKEYFAVNNLECPIEEGNDFSVSAETAHRQLQKVLPAYFVTSDTVDYKKGVELQAVATKYIDHGLSRTINLPRGTTKEQVSEVYMSAHKMGLKGVTVYIDGSRDGVLLTGSEKKDNRVRPEKIVDNYAPKRPKSLPSEIHHVKIKGQSWAVVVGLMDGRVYEIFAGAGLVIPKERTIEEAFIIKKGPKKYCLEVRIKDSGVEEVGDLKEIYDNEEQRVITKSVCLSLRHGVPIEFCIRSLQNHEGSISDYSSALARVLKKYATRPSLMVKVCPQCDGTEFVMQDGCPSCKSCSWTKCS